MGRRAGLDRCGKSHPHRDSIPGVPSNIVYVTRPTVSCIKILMFSSYLGFIDVFNPDSILFNTIFIVILTL
jgi:hypothetical protein